MIIARAHLPINFPNGENGAEIHSRLLRVLAHKFDAVSTWDIQTARWKNEVLCLEQMRVYECISENNDLLRFSESTSNAARDLGVSAFGIVTTQSHGGKQVTSGEI